jgi:hypothetical protein
MSMARIALTLLPIAVAIATVVTWLALTVYPAATAALAVLADRLVPPKKRIMTDKVMVKRAE